MAIKNKDGTPFRRNKPNPIMSNQDFWDDGLPFTLHNFTYEEIVSYNFSHEEQIFHTEDEEVSEDFQKLEDIEPFDINVPIKETPVPESAKKKERITKADVLLMYCLPASQKIVIDSVYGEKRSAITFGEQFTFQGVIKSQNDLSIQIWTNVIEIERRSILYVPSQRRWWSVDTTEDFANGRLLHCIISAVQPSFST